MRLVVFGGTGGTGRELVRLALQAGHEVTAVVRDPAKLAVDDRNLRVVNADIFDAAALEPHLQGRDAVLSALGGSGSVCARSARSILQAMRAVGPRRLVVVSAAPVLTTGAGERALYRATVRPILRAAFRDAYADLAEMEGLLAESGVDWTVLRPPNLTNKPGSRRYRTATEANILGGYSIARADLAQAMLDVVDDPATYRHALGVAAARATPA